MVVHTPDGLRLLNLHKVEFVAEGTKGSIVYFTGPEACSMGINETLTEVVKIINQEHPSSE
jgi:hypothetical protein